MVQAIIKTGGKQYSVQEGDVIDIELLPADPGSKVHFSEILFTADGSERCVGSPTISDFVVEGEVIGIVPGKKVTTLKYKRSHNQCRKWGHRQKYTRVKITKVAKSDSKRKAA